MGPGACPQYFDKRAMHQSGPPTIKVQHVRSHKNHEMLLLFKLPEFGQLNQENQ